eukprot:8250719-Alexandrium_andersonii.AAC.1
MKASGQCLRQGQPSAVITFLSRCADVHFGSQDDPPAAPPHLRAALQWRDPEFPALAWPSR